MISQYDFFSTCLGYLQVAVKSNEVYCLLFIVFTCQLLVM